MNTRNSIPLGTGYNLEDYIIDHVISIDSVSITYKASAQTSNHFVIKEYYPVNIVERGLEGELTVYEESLQGIFNREKKQFTELGKIISEIDSPILVNMVDVITCNNTAYIVSQYEDAYSLSEILKQTPVLDYEDIKYIIFPILENLRILHSKNLYHLSIKPDNILIRKDGTPILTGFGSYFASPVNESYTGTVNNYIYAPAEQFTRQTNMIGGWSDIYSLGAVLYQCISGNPPEQSLKRYESIKNFGKDNNKAADIGRDKYSTVMLNAIDHALEIRPKDRPKTLDEWTREFLELAPKDKLLDRGSVPDLNETLKIEGLKNKESYDRVVEDESRYKLYLAFLGGKKQSYYMAFLINQEQHGFWPISSWNGSAFVFGIFWMFYRKMYLFAVLLLIIFAALTRYLTYPIFQNYSNINTYWLINPPIDFALISCISIMALTLGFYGNYIYYLYILGKLRNIDKHIITVDSKRKLLSERTSTSISISIIMFILIGSGAYFGYQRLIIRERSAVKQVNEAINALIYARNEVRKFKSKNNRWPNNTEEIFGKLNFFRYQYVGEVSILKQLIVVTFKEQGNVLSEFSGKSFALVGNENKKDKKIYWICGSIDMPLAYLPTDCKQILK